MADLTLSPGPASSGDGRGARGHRAGPPAAERRGAGSNGEPEEAPAIDPRAVRVRLGPASRLGSEGPIIVAPPAEPLAPRRESLAGKGLLGGQPPLPSGAVPGSGADETPVTDAAAAPGPTVLVDGEPTPLRLVPRGSGRATLVEGEGAPARRARVVFTGGPVTGPDGITRREVVIDGWRIEVELEPERRAALRERARSGHESTARGGPTEVHAIIPGRVVSVSVAKGDALTAGQQILVVEAMKMQNELRAPRDGTVQKVGVAPGDTIEVGDLLLVIG